MSKTPLLVIGAGGHGRSVAEAASLSGVFEVVGFLDDHLPLGEVVLDTLVLGTVACMDTYRYLSDQVIVAIGNNVVREQLMLQLEHVGFEFATVVHPRAFVSPTSELGKGSVVMAGAIVGTQAYLGKGTIVNCGAVVDHQATVDDFGHLGVNASMAGAAVLGRGAWLQAGAVLGYGVKTPAGAVLPAGQVWDRHTNKINNG